LSRIEAAGATIQGGMTGRADAWRIDAASGEGCMAVVADAPGFGIALDKLGDALTAPGHSGLAAALKAVAPGAGETGALAAVRFLADRIEFAACGDISILRFREGEVHQVAAREPRFIDREFDAALGKVDWREVLESDARFEARQQAAAGQAIRSGERRTQGGDVYLIATDGLDAVGQELLRRLVCESGAASPDDLARMAVEAAEAYGRAFQGGRHDHATAVVARYPQSETQPAGEPTKKAAPLRPLPLALAVLAGIAIGGGASPFVLRLFQPETVVASDATAPAQEVAAKPEEPPAEVRPPERAKARGGTTPYGPPAPAEAIVADREPRIFPALPEPAAPPEDPRATGPR